MSISSKAATRGPISVMWETVSEACNLACLN